MFWKHIISTRTICVPSEKSTDAYLVKIPQFDRKSNVKYPAHKGPSLAS